MTESQEKLILRPKDVKKLLGLGRVQVYELFKRPDFPAKKHGKSLFVSKKAFLEWLERRDEEQ